MNYQKYIMDLYKKGQEEGLTKLDYRILKHYYCEISNEIKKENISRQSKNELEVILKDFYSLFSLLKDDYGKKIPYENIEYLRMNSIFSGLAFANRISDKIKFLSQDNYVFLCTFHKEKTPSMSVSDSKNLFYCYGCGMGGNIFNYLMDYENLTFLESVYLLAEIFGIEFPDNIFNRDNEIVQKYRSSIISEEYADLLNKSMNSIIKKESKYDVNQIKNHLLNEWQTAEDYFNHKFETIERIKKQLNDEKFIYIPQKKLVFLEKENHKKEKTKVKEISYIDKEDYIFQYFDINN